MENMIYPREKYLSKIRPFYDSDVVKVITGIRRSGKTSILKAIISELESRNLYDRIIYLPLDKRGYKNIVTPTQLESKIEERKVAHSGTVFSAPVYKCVGTATLIKAGDRIAQMILRKKYDADLVEVVNEDEQR